MTNILDLRCKNCGSTLKTYFSFNRAICEYCGSNYYLENTSDLQKPVMQDSPINIRLVREENADPLYLIGFGKDRDGDYITDLNSFAKGGSGILYAVCYISAISSFLKKSYKINDLTMRGGHLDDWLNDNYNFSKRWYRKICHVSAIDAEKPYEHYKNISSEHKLEREKFISCLRNYKIDVSDSVSRCYERHDWGMKKVIMNEWDNHTLILKFPLITPEYFQKYFSDIYEKVEKMIHNDVIQTIASSFFTNGNSPLLSEYISRTGSPVLHTHISRTGITVNKHHVDFHSVGMEYIDDENVLKYVELAMLYHLLNKTYKNGKNMLDIDSRVVYITCGTYDDKSIDGSSYCIVKEHLFKYLEKAVPEYQSWS